MKKAIVTGSNGFIGSNVCKRLCADGIKVFAVVKDENENIDISVRNHVSQGFDLIKLAIHNFNAAEILYLIDVFVFILNNGKHLYTVGTKPFADI